jgi:hypothetical protein
VPVIFITIRPAQSCLRARRLTWAGANVIGTFPSPTDAAHTVSGSIHIEKNATSPASEPCFTMRPKQREADRCTFVKAWSKAASTSRLMGITPPGSLNAPDLAVSAYQRG